MSAKRPAINRDLLEGLERQLSDAMERVSDDDPLAELARLIEEDPFAEDIASPPAESPRGRPVDVARQAPQAFHDEPPTGYRPEVEANYTPEPSRSGVTPDPGIRGSTDPLADLLTADAIAEELRRTSAPEPTPVAAPEPDFDFTEQLSRRIAPEPDPAPDLAATNDIFLDPGCSNPSRLRMSCTLIRPIGTIQEVFSAMVDRRRRQNSMIRSRRRSRSAALLAGMRTSRRRRGVARSGTIRFSTMPRPIRASTTGTHSPSRRTMAMPIVMRGQSPTKCQATTGCAGSSSSLPSSVS